LIIFSEHKKAIEWSLLDIKGISPDVIKHQIHLEENAKNSHELQRRLNPAMKDVVRTEVLKLLDVGLFTRFLIVCELGCVWLQGSGQQ